MNAPYYLLRGGYLSNSSLSLAGSYGSYWSSTPFRSGNVNTDTGLRYNGRSVRCVAAG